MRACRHLFRALVLFPGFLGCAWERHELEEERTRLEQRRDAVREQLDRNAPVGSRWVPHRDTEMLLGDLNSSDARIREIDKQLGQR